MVDTLTSLTISREGSTAALSSLSIKPGESVQLTVTGSYWGRTALRGWRTAFEKLGHRSQVTISRIGMAMALLQDGDGVVQDARVVIGAIKPIPFPLPEAEEVLRGKKPDPALAIAIGETFKGNTRRAYKEAAAKGVAEDVLLRFQK